MLTPDTALSHLFHFCAVLPHEPYVDLRPQISFETRADDFLKATITLPSSVHAAARKTTGLAWWQSERAATKDAAFEAYKRLYQLELVNDNLLPLKHKSELRANGGGPDLLPSMIEVAAQVDPWLKLADAWSSPESIHQLHITVAMVEKNGNPSPTGDDLCFHLTLPVADLPSLEPLTLYWSSTITYTLTFEPARHVPKLSLEVIETMRETTFTYLTAPHYKANHKYKDYVALFSPSRCGQSGTLEDWLKEYTGTYPAMNDSERWANPACMGLIRYTPEARLPYLFKEWLVSLNNDEDGDGEPAKFELKCTRLPRRKNLIHANVLPSEETIETIDEAPPGDGLGSSGSPDGSAAGPSPSPSSNTVSNKLIIFPASDCTVDKLPAREAIFGLFIPSILDHLEVALIAHELRQTILREVPFSSSRLVITAITAASANAVTNYERLEFFGDSVLKFVVSCQQFLQHANWHEGYLSESRDEIVKNSRLARVAIDTGLDAYIIDKQFTPRKWLPPCISGKLADGAAAVQKQRRRMMSTKVLADVIEALIGAAYTDGGLDLARTCIHRFLPEVDSGSPDFGQWQSVRALHPGSVYSKSSQRNNMLSPAVLRHIGHPFRDESLLVEALTHPSYRNDARTDSYQRLEFLGDAVLDMIVVSTIARQGSVIGPYEMTIIKHAVVNANLLAFFCMEYAYTEHTNAIKTVVGKTGQVSSPLHDSSSSNNSNAAVTTSLTIAVEERRVALWSFLRCWGRNLRVSRDACLARHEQLRATIAVQLASSPTYPWEALSALKADKFFSDIVESTLGAIFIDSEGDLMSCERFLERIGLLPYLRRILADKAPAAVNVLHPRAVAQRLAKSNSIRYVVQRDTPWASTAASAATNTAGPDRQAAQPNVEGVDAAPAADAGAEPDAANVQLETGRYSCVVKLNETDLVAVQGCVSEEHAEICAAQEAVKILSSMDDMSARPGCKKRRMNTDVEAAASGLNLAADEPQTSYGS